MKKYIILKRETREAAANDNQYTNTSNSLNYQLNSVIDLGGPHPCRVPGPPRHRHAQARPSCDWACLCLWSKSLERAWACLQSLKLLLGVPVPCPVPGASGTGRPKEARLFLDIGSLLWNVSKNGKVVSRCWC